MARTQDMNRNEDVRHFQICAGLERGGVLRRWRWQWGGVGGGELTGSEDGELKAETDE